MAITAADEVRFAPPEGAIKLRGLQYTDDPSSIRADRAAEASNIRFDHDVFGTSYQMSDYSPAMPDGNPVRHIFDFEDQSGTLHHIFVTDDNVFNYKANQLYVLTEGVVVEDCEDDWTTGAATSSAADATYSRVGTKSVKLVIPGATTGLMAYEDITDVQLDTYNQVSFWVRSSAAVPAFSLNVRLSLNDNCGTADVEVDVEVALVADTWTLLVYDVDLSAFAVGTKCKAVGVDLDVSISGGANIWFDDIRATKKLVGASAQAVTHAEEYITVETDSYFIINNGKQQPQVSNGVDIMDEISDDLATGPPTNLYETTYNYAEGIVKFENHLVGWYPNMQSDSASRETWVFWANRLDATEYTATDNINATEHPGVMKQMVRHEQGLLGLTSAAIFYMVYLGPPYYFNLGRRLGLVGTPSKKTAVPTAVGTFFLGWDDVYLVRGFTVESIGLDIREDLYSQIDVTKVDTAFAVSVPRHDEYRLYVPSRDATTYPDLCYIYNWRTQGWSKKSESVSCGNVSFLLDGVVIDNLTGTIDNLSGTIDSLSKSTGSVSLLLGDASDNKVKLFAYDGHENTCSMKTQEYYIAGAGMKERFQGITVSLRGTQCVVVFHCDGTVARAKLITPDSTTKYSTHEVWADRACEKVQIEFHTAGGWFECRHFRLKGIPYGRL